MGPFQLLGWPPLGRKPSFSVCACVGDVCWTSLLKAKQVSFRVYLNASLKKKCKMTAFFPEETREKSVFSRQMFLHWGLSCSSLLCVPKCLCSHPGGIVLGYS